MYILAFELLYKFQWCYKIYSIRPVLFQSQQWNDGEEEATGGEPSASVSYGTSVTQQQVGVILSSAEVWNSQLFALLSFKLKKKFKKKKKFFMLNSFAADEGICAAIVYCDIH